MSKVVLSNTGLSAVMFKISSLCLEWPSPPFHEVSTPNFLDSDWVGMHGGVIPEENVAFGTPKV
eukprot:1216925-Amphidinium_carterae.1